MHSSRTTDSISAARLWGCANDLQPSHPLPRGSLSIVHRHALYEPCPRLSTLSTLRNVWLRAETERASRLGAHAPASARSPAKMAREDVGPARTRVPGPLAAANELDGGAARLVDRHDDGARGGAVESPAERRWWATLELNQRPPACRAGALPTELVAHADSAV